MNADTLKRFALRFVGVWLGIIALGVVIVVLWLVIFLPLHIWGLATQGGLIGTWNYTSPPTPVSVATVIWELSAIAAFLTAMSMGNEL